MDILIGTRNAYKAGEMEHMLKDIPDVNIHFLKETTINLDIEEDGKSLTENAEKKAIEISKYTDMYVLASDGGIDIPGLGDKWDMQTSQRNVGHDNTDLEKVNKLLTMMMGLKGEQRKITNLLALAIAYKGKHIWSQEDITDEGYVSEDLIDEDIPPYMWIGHAWYYPKFRKVFNKLSKEELEEVREMEEGIKNKLGSKIRSLI